MTVIIWILKDKSLGVYDKEAMSSDLLAKLYKTIPLKGSVLILGVEKEEK